jgi:hypothetical protein
VEVQEVRRVKDDSQPVGDYTFFHGNGNADRQLGTGSFVHKGIISAVKTTEFISDNMSCVTLRGRWCDIVFPNVHV